MVLLQLSVSSVERSVERRELESTAGGSSAMRHVRLAGVRFVGGTDGRTERTRKFETSAHIRHASVGWCTIQKPDPAVGISVRTNP